MNTREGILEACLCVAMSMQAARQDWVSNNNTTTDMFAVCWFPYHQIYLILGRVIAVVELVCLSARNRYPKT